MLILAYDCTSEYGGAAIYRDDQCLASVANDGPANLYSVTLFQIVERLLSEVREREALPRFSLRDIDLFAAANGPGSFTGIRVGMAAALAWAKAFGRPARGVSVLEAMVEEARPATDLAVPILDARRDEFFLASFRRLDGNNQKRFKAEGEGIVVKALTLPTFLVERFPASAGVTCLARQSDHAAQALRELLPDSFNWQSVPPFLVGAVARLAFFAHRQGKEQSSPELNAYYIRRPDAELHWRG